MPPPNVDQARWFTDEVQPHESAVRSWLRIRFPWLADADDVAREAVLRVWRLGSGSQGVEVKRPKAALFTIARNAAYDAGRRRAVAEIKSVVEIEQLSVLDPHADVAEAVSTRQELEVLAEALRELPTRCRQVLTLCKMYGYSQKEVAEKLGISEHTVRALVAKGMRRCAEYLRRRGVKHP